MGRGLGLAGITKERTRLIKSDLGLKRIHQFRIVPARSKLLRVPGGRHRFGKSSRFSTGRREGAESGEAVTGRDCVRLCRAEARRRRKDQLVAVRKHLRLGFATAALQGKAAVNTPHSKRFAKFGDARQLRQSRFAGECGGFSTAFNGGRAGTDWPQSRKRLLAIFRSQFQGRS